jgi:hypothetical protein
MCFVGYCVQNTIYLTGTVVLNWHKFGVLFSIFVYYMLQLYYFCKKLWSQTLIIYLPPVWMLLFTVVLLCMTQHFKLGRPLFYQMPCYFTDLSCQSGTITVHYFCTLLLYLFLDNFCTGKAWEEYVICFQFISTTKSLIRNHICLSTLRKTCTRNEY